MAGLFHFFYHAYQANHSYQVPDDGEKLIRKGAFIDKEFFSDGTSLFASPSDFEKAHSKSTLTYYTYTPLAMAVEKGNQSLIKFILEAKKGDLSSDAKQGARRIASQKRIAIAVDGYLVNRVLGEAVRI